MFTESNSTETNQEKLQIAFEQLKKTVDVLKELGLSVHDRFISIQTLKRPTADAGFPLASDGNDGVRASYSPQKGFRVWFTNFFEDPGNETRLKITKELKKININVN